MRRRKGRAAALHEPAASAVAPLAPDVRQDMEPAEGSGGTDGRILGDLGPTARPTVRVVWRLATASPRPSAAKAWAAAVAAVAALVKRLAAVPQIRQPTAVTGGQNTASRRLLER
jgi:hypothetical protein